MFDKVSDLWFLVLTVTFSFLMTGCACVANTNSPTTFRVMSYNIHHAEGTDGKVDVQRIADLIKAENVDVVGLQEIDRGVKRTDGRDIIKELSKLTGMDFYFDRNIQYQGGEYGNAVLTRFPMLKKKNTHYKMLRPGEQRGIQQVLINVHGKKFMFMNTHIDYREDDQEREMNVREMKTIVGQNSEFPIVIAGDFNSNPDSRVCDGMRIFINDAWDLAGKGDGFTFPSDKAEKRIDYLWVSKGESIKTLRVWVPSSQASDHLPVVADFQLP